MTFLKIIASRILTIDGVTIYRQVTERYGRPMIGESGTIHVACAPSTKREATPMMNHILMIAKAYESQGTPLTMKGLIAHLVIEFGLRKTDEVFDHLKAYSRCLRGNLVNGPGLHKSIWWLFRKNNFTRVVDAIPEPPSVFTTVDIAEATDEKTKPNSSYVGEALEIMHLTGHVVKLIYHSKKRSMMWQSLGLTGGEPLPPQNGALTAHLKNNFAFLLLSLVQGSPDGMTSGDLARHPEVAALVKTTIMVRGTPTLKYTGVDDTLRALTGYLDLKRVTRADHMGRERILKIYRLNSEGRQLLATDPLSMVRQLSELPSRSAVHEAA